MLNFYRPIESQLLAFMREAILAEIVLGNIFNLIETIHFIKATFYYVRLRKNPLHYGFKNINDLEGFLFE